MHQRCLPWHCPRGHAVCWCCGAAAGLARAPAPAPAPAPAGLSLNSGQALVTAAQPPGPGPNLYDLTARRQPGPATGFRHGNISRRTALASFYQGPAWSCLALGLDVAQAESGLRIWERPICVACVARSPTAREAPESQNQVRMACVALSPSPGRNR